MNIRRLLRCVVLLPALALALPLAAAIDDRPGPAELPSPSPALTAEDVVRIVVEALADNDRPYPDAGIAITWRFASPGNRAQTGPLARFARMVKGEPYGLMVGHVDREFSEIVYEGDTAYQMVHLLGTDGRAIVYGFRLSRQQGGAYDGMWMTDAVWPIAVHAGRAPAL